MTQAIPAGAFGLTESQYRIAESLGWTKESAFSPFREFIRYLDDIFERMTTKDPVSIQLPEMAQPAENGKPFHAMINHCILAVSREYVSGEAVYTSNYSLLQASEEYQETLSNMIRHLTRGRESAVFSKVTRITPDFDITRNSILTCCSVESDVFIPTGLCKGLSRQNGAHITDAEVFSSIVMDYTKVMQKIQRCGYELRTHFYLTRGCDIQLILAEPEKAEEIWAYGGFRDYRCVSISDEGEVVLQLRQEVVN